MSDELIVYGRHASLPNAAEVRQLVEVAGWSMALIQDAQAFNPARLAESPLVVGWPSHGRRSEKIRRAVEQRDIGALSGMAEDLVALDLTIVQSYSTSPDELEEFRMAGLEPELLDRIAQANLKVVSEVRSGAFDEAVEFSWAVASAFGVLTDGVLEDVEEGWVTDCTDLDDLDG